MQPDQDIEFQQRRAQMIARVCHEVNRAYCQALGDNSQPAWEDAPQWQRDSAIGAFRTNDGKGPVSVYHLTKIPAIPGIPEETDAAIDAAMQKETP